LTNMHEVNVLRMMIESIVACIVSLLKAKSLSFFRKMIALVFTSEVFFLVLICIHKTKHKF